MPSGQAPRGVSRWQIRHGEVLLAAASGRCSHGGHRKPSGSLSASSSRRARARWQRQFRLPQAPSGRAQAPQQPDSRVGWTVTRFVCSITPSVLWHQQPPRHGELVSHVTQQTPPVVAVCPRVQEEMIVASSNGNGVPGVTCHHCPLGDSTINRELSSTTALTGPAGPLRPA